MRILIDQKILLAEEAFATIGDVTAMSGNEIDAEIAAGADILVTRTTTKVNTQLLQHSKIKFVATATAGTDHIDLDYLAAHQIGFTSAPGCNSMAVGEFVVNALLQLQTKKALTLKNKTLGIIGCGNAGSALKKKAECLGLKCLLNDPPLQEKTGAPHFSSLTDVVAQSDIISLHVPLIKSGIHPTYHLINKPVFEQMKPNAILVNTCRGGVVCESDLKKHRNQLGGLILDVWENEPAIDFETLSLADIATPHIAGYSLDGKYKATEIVYQKVCDYFGLNPTWSSPRCHQDYQNTIVTKGNASMLGDILRQTYDIFNDDATLRQIVNTSNPELYFRSLRNEYDFRSEFSNFLVSSSDLIDETTLQQIRCLGFRLN